MHSIVLLTALTATSGLFGGWRQQATYPYGGCPTCPAATQAYGYAPQATCATGTCPMVAQVAQAPAAYQAPAVAQAPAQTPAVAPAQAPAQPAPAAANAAQVVPTAYYYPSYYYPPSTCPDGNCAMVYYYQR